MREAVLKMKLRVVDANTVLIKQFSRGSECFFLIDGQIAVFIKPFEDGASRAVSVKSNLSAVVGKDANLRKLVYSPDDDPAVSEADTTPVITTQAPNDSRESQAVPRPLDNRPTPLTHADISRQPSALLTPAASRGNILGHSAISEAFTAIPDDENPYFNRGEGTVINAKGLGSLVNCMDAAGTCIGERSLLSDNDQCTAASCVAATRCYFMMLGKEQFESLIKDAKLRDQSFKTDFFRKAFLGLPPVSDRDNNSDEKPLRTSRTNGLVGKMYGETTVPDDIVKATLGGIRKLVSAGTAKHRGSTAGESGGNDEFLLEVVFQRGVMIPMGSDQTSADPPSIRRGLIPAEDGTTPSGPSNGATGELSDVCLSAAKQRFVYFLVEGTVEYRAHVRVPSVSLDGEKKALRRLHIAAGGGKGSRVGVPQPDLDAVSVRSTEQYSTVAQLRGHSFCGGSSALLGIYEPFDIVVTSAEARFFKVSVHNIRTKLNSHILQWMVKQCHAFLQSAMDRRVDRLHAQTNLLSRQLAQRNAAVPDIKSSPFLRHKIAILEQEIKDSQSTSLLDFANLSSAAGHNPPAATSKQSSPVRATRSSAFSPSQPKGSTFPPLAEEADEAAYADDPQDDPAFSPSVSKDQTPLPAGLALKTKRSLADYPSFTPKTNSSSASASGIKGVSVSPPPPPSRAEFRQNFLKQVGVMAKHFEGWQPPNVAIESRSDQEAQDHRLSSPMKNQPLPALPPDISGLLKLTTPNTDKFTTTPWATAQVMDSFLGQSKGHSLSMASLDRWGSVSVPAPSVLRTAGYVHETLLPADAAHAAVDSEIVHSAHVLRTLKTLAPPAGGGSPVRSKTEIRSLKSSQQPAKDSWAVSYLSSAPPRSASALLQPPSSQRPATTSSPSPAKAGSPAATMKRSATAQPMKSASAPRAGGGGGAGNDETSRHTSMAELRAKFDFRDVRQDPYLPPHDPTFGERWRVAHHLRGNLRGFELLTPAAKQKFLQAELRRDRRHEADLQLGRQLLVAAAMGPKEVSAVVAQRSEQQMQAYLHLAEDDLIRNKRGLTKALSQNALQGSGYAGR